MQGIDQNANVKWSNVGIGQSHRTNINPILVLKCLWRTSKSTIYCNNSLRFPSRGKKYLLRLQQITASNVKCSLKQMKINKGRNFAIVQTKCFVFAFLKLYRLADRLFFYWFLTKIDNAVSSKALEVFCHDCVESHSICSLTAAHF